MPSFTPVEAGDLMPVVDALGNQFNVDSVLGVVGLSIVACAGLAFLWWGGRKLVRMLMAAFKKGKISV
jgi:hypothetical protein